MIELIDSSAKLHVQISVDTYFELSICLWNLANGFNAVNPYEI